MRRSRFPRALLVVVAVGSGACRPTPPAPSDEMSVAHAPTAAAAAGTRVAIQGVAGNAKAGAEIETDDREVVYIRGLGKWPAAIARTRVHATGTLRIEHHEDPCPTPGEHCAAGVAGDQRWLEDAVLTDESGKRIVTP